MRPKQVESKNTYFSIGLSIGGQLLTRIGLSRLEYEAIKNLRFEDAIGRIMKKEPFLKRDIVMAAAIVDHIKNGNVQVIEE
jgi:hypothetical protein